MKMTTGLNNLIQLMGDATLEIHGFSIDITENGYILSLILTFEKNDVTKKITPTFSFDSNTNIEKLVEIIIAKINLQLVTKAKKEN